MMERAPCVIFVVLAGLIAVGHASEEKGIPTSQEVEEITSILQSISSPEFDGVFAKNDSTTIPLTSKAQGDTQIENLAKEMESLVDAQEKQLNSNNTHHHNRKRSHRQQTMFVKRMQHIAQKHLNNLKANLSKVERNIESLKTDFNTKLQKLTQNADAIKEEIADVRGYATEDSSEEETSGDVDKSESDPDNSNQIEDEADDEDKEADD
ncbi:hypothetical protein AAMO2058_000023400 [Amorphochlora amoebiformis]